MKRYLFIPTDKHKKITGQPQFFFTENSKHKVFKWIKNNLADYFDGNRLEQERKFKEFKELVNKEGIAKGINTSTDLYARATEIKSIKEL